MPGYFYLTTKVILRLHRRMFQTFSYYRGWWNHFNSVCAQRSRFELRVW